MPKAMTRRQALFGTVALSAGTFVSLHSAYAGDWPARTIKIVVGGGAGSVPDTLARISADALSAKLGQPVIIENRPGAGGILAMQTLVKNVPDGYTIGLGTVSQVVFNSYLFSRLPYDPRHDIMPIAKLVASSFVLAAHPSVMPNDLAGIAALSQREPGKLLIGIPANGSPPHIAAILLLQEAQLKATFVPFRSGPDALAALMRGDIQLLVDGPTLLAPYIVGRKLKAIVVTGQHRQPTLADVPTVAEAGHKSAECESWMGLFAPQGTSPEIIARLSLATHDILNNNLITNKLRTLDFVPQYAAPEDFAVFIGREHQRWAGVLRASGVKLG